MIERDYEPGQMDVVPAINFDSSCIYYFACLRRASCIAIKCEYPEDSGDDEIHMRQAESPSQLIMHELVSVGADSQTDLLQHPS